MFDDLIKFWKLIKAAYDDRQLWRGMYYYLTGVLVVVGGLYLYLLYAGYIGFAILFSHLAGTPVPVVSGVASINIVQAAGMLLVLRYMVLGSLDAMSKRTPENLDHRLREIESKIGELHKLAFGEVSEPKEQPPKLKPALPDKKGRRNGKA